LFLLVKNKNKGRVSSKRASERAKQEAGAPSVESKTDRTDEASDQSILNRINSLEATTPSSCFRRYILSSNH
jgi:hypothetical protein